MFSIILEIKTVFAHSINDISTVWTGLLPVCHDQLWLTLFHFHIGNYLIWHKYSIPIAQRKCWDGLFDPFVLAVGSLSTCLTSTCASGWEAAVPRCAPRGLQPGENQIIDTFDCANGFYFLLVKPVQGVSYSLPDRARIIWDICSHILSLYLSVISTDSRFHSYRA